MRVTHLLRIVVPFALGYFTSYLFRSVNAVLAPKLTLELGLDAADLGFLTSMYFLSFAAMQIPLGIWLDKYQAHKIEALLMVIAAGGAFVFAISETLMGVAFGRLLIGVGVSACLMAAFRAFTHWFEPKELTHMNGIQLASGGLGALFATEPTALMADAYGWRAVFWALGVLTLLIALLLWIMVPDSTPDHSDEPTSIGYKEIFTSRAFLTIAPVSAIIQASYISLLGLWAHPWLHYVSGTGEHAATNTLFWATVAMTVGFVSWGSLSSYLEGKGFNPLNTAFVGMGLFTLTFALIIFNPTLLPTPLWMLLAFFGVSSPINYAVLSRQFPKKVSGRAITALNLLSFIFSFILQWGIGILVDFYPPLDSGGYPAIAYTMAFGCLLVVIIALMVLYLIQKPKLQASPPLSNK